MVETLIILLAPIVGVCLGVFWLIFFLFEDREKPEPFLMIVATFLLGFLAALAAAFVQYLIANFMLFPWYSLPSLFINGAIEEVAKLLVILIFIKRSVFFDEPVDFMIYLITAGLGFATIENILFLASTAGFEEFIGLASLRFVGATLMHALAAGFIGYFWAKNKLLLGLLIASIIHAAFNHVIIYFGPIIYPTVLLIVTAIVLFYLFDTLKYNYEKPK